ncbi:hypothetical protein LCGC14_2892720, partial [marine sediment metagenome]
AKRLFIPQLGTRGIFGLATEG